MCGSHDLGNAHSENRSPRRAPLVILSVILLAAYFAGYLFAGINQYGTYDGLRAKYVTYRPDLLGKLFIPTTWMEAKLTGKIVHVRRSNVYGDFDHDFIATPY